MGYGGIVRYLADFSCQVSNRNHTSDRASRTWRISKRRNELWKPINLLHIANQTALARPLDNTADLSFLFVIL